VTRGSLIVFAAGLVSLCLLAGCVERKVVVRRDQLDLVPATGRIQVTDGRAGQLDVSARRVSVVGVGDLVDDLIRDGILFTPEDTERLPTTDGEMSQFRAHWEAVPDWQEAELLFAVHEPEVAGWVAAGSFVGGALAGYAAYEGISCGEYGDLCETQQGHIALTVLLGLCGAMAGGGTMYSLYNLSPGPTYSWVP